MQASKGKHVSVSFLLHPRRNPATKKGPEVPKPRSYASSFHADIVFLKLSSRITCVRKLAEQYREKGKQRRCPSVMDV